MANRNMAQKRLKLNKQRRLFPRYLGADYIPTGKPPNMLVMQELKERTKSLAHSEEYAAYLVRREKLEHFYPHPGREEVKAHIQRIKETAPALMCVTLSNTVMRKVLMFYNEERTRFILFEDNVSEGVLRTSLPYADRKRCIARFQSNRVQWVQFSSVAPTPHSKSD